MSIDDARRLVFRVASDPALLNRFAEVAATAEEDPTACDKLAEMIRELNPRVSIAEMRQIREEIERVEAHELRAEHPTLEHDAVEEHARQQRMTTIQWLRRAAFSAANYCSS